MPEGALGVFRGTLGAPEDVFLVFFVVNAQMLLVYEKSLEIFRLIVY